MRTVPTRAMVVITGYTWLSFCATNGQAPYGKYLLLSARARNKRRSLSSDHIPAAIRHDHLDAVSSYFASLEWFGWHVRDCVRSSTQGHQTRGRPRPGN